MEWPGTYIQIGVPQTSNNVKSSFHKTPSSSSAGTCTQTETRDLIALHCNVWWSAESDHSLKWELVWLIWKIKPLSNMNTGVNCQVFDGIMKYGHTTEAARQLCKGHHSFSLKHSKVDLHIWKNVSGNKSFDILISDAENTVSSPSQGAPTYSQTAVQRPSAPFIETISSLTCQWICNSDGTIFP